MSVDSRFVGMGSYVWMCIGMDRRFTCVGMDVDSHVWIWI